MITLPAIIQPKWADSLLNDSAAKKFIPPNVIGQIGKRHIGLGSGQPYAPNRYSVHMAGHEAENVFDPYTEMRFCFVAFLLFRGQRVIAVSRFMYSVLDPARYLALNLLSGISPHPHIQLYHFRPIGQ